MNGKDLNTTVKKTVTASLKGGKNKCNPFVATDFEKYSDEDEAFDIDRIKLAASECHYEMANGRRSTTKNILH